ncbi:pimeloyl-ACP methyl ester carboxylesterase [Kibdelosporangium banguiense]|uniref:Pimeloyl-ACP methyl ester carboxylesterase n=1 Tax=Kibdelosporangium banguiense TaxID=1365924 RepID=A0ABS4TRY5_9PSEU|nr:alpha/beta hydrolase [Kibdelosporangium banguiense]MBP2327166.1 pimeloyl-ACP methyl ester carboxylesterase [Kibdelosporangium banguiense]
MDSVPIRLDVPAPDGTWQLAGDLYLPSGDQPDTVQVLLSGLTYDRRYWLAPGAGNYVRHMVADGHAVLALDRIGTGDSSHPPAMDVTVQANVDTLHELVLALRAGIAGLNPFARVIAVGHSLGTGIAIIGAAQHRDFDALILTGLTHTFGPLYQDAVGSLEPAEGLPEGYLTTQPGKRGVIYEFEGGVDWALTEYHEATKSTVTIGEGSTVDEIYRPGYSAAVDVPVLLVVGREDRLFVDAEQERDFYRGAPDFDLFVVPQAAHSINVHRTAHLWFAAASRQLARWAAATRTTSA